MAVVATGAQRGGGGAFLSFRPLAPCLLPRAPSSSWMHPESRIHLPQWVSILRNGWNHYWRREGGWKGGREGGGGYKDEEEKKANKNSYEV